MFLGADYLHDNEKTDKKKTKTNMKTKAKTKTKTIGQAHLGVYTCWAQNTRTVE